MKCDYCGKEAEKGHLIFGQGFACSTSCGDQMSAARQAFNDELAAEELCEMPEMLDTADFERWALKFAIHFIRKLSDGERKKLARNNPMLLVPEELALDFKERILRHVHRAYVSETNNRGHARLFCGGSYMFRKPVPAEHIVEACRQADLIA